MQGEKPYRGARAGAKQRKRHFYEAQDRLQEVSLRIWNIRVRRREYETTTEVVVRFGSLADEVDADHLIWADLTDFYPELWAAFTDITAEPSQSSRPRHWQPKARSEAAASSGGAAAGAPQPEAAASEPKAPAAAPPLGSEGAHSGPLLPKAVRSIAAARPDCSGGGGGARRGRTAGIRATRKTRGGLDDSWRKCPGHRPQICKASAHAAVPTSPRRSRL